MKKNLRIVCDWCEKAWENDGTDWYNVTVVQDYVDIGCHHRAMQDFCCLNHTVAYLCNIQDQLAEHGTAVSETMYVANKRRQAEYERGEY